MTAFRNWQAFLDTTIDAYCSSNQMHEFSQLKTFTDRVQYVTQNATLSNVSWLSEYFEERKHRQTIRSRKIRSIALDFRKKGNKHFVKKDNEQALSCYNQCVINAPHKSEELALGYANRSAALFHMNKYTACINDIKHALALGHPNPLKLRLRKARALRQVDRTEEACQELERILHTEDWSLGADKTKKEFAKQEVEQLLKDLKDMELAPEIVQKPKIVPDVMGGPNPFMTQASNAMQLHMTPELGRHLVASAFIQAGSVLVVEKPYAAVLLPPHFLTHCQHCYSKLVIYIPCLMCPDVAFCSEECREKAVYHRIECPYLDLIESVGIAHLSLRVILNAGLGYLKGFKHEAKKTRQIPGTTPNGKYSRSYFAVYDLMAHDNDMDPGDLLQYTLTARLLLELLRTARFFPTMDTSRTLNVLTPTELYIGSLLLRHICQLTCNAHAITEIQRTSRSAHSLVEDTEQVRIATAIYPTVSLMNHACDPSIIASFDGNLLIVRAVKDIKKGEQIYNCYGPHAKRMPYEKRQKHLQEQYFFTCDCPACHKHGKEELRYRALLCPMCKGALPICMEETSKCLDCDKVVPISKPLKSMMQTEQDFIRGILCIERNSRQEALKHLESCLKQRQKILYKHNRQLAECRDALAKCHVTLGHWQEAEKLLADSIKTLEEIYGPSSIELANELRKLADVLFRIHRTPRLKATISRARDIFFTHYGYCHDDVLEMDEMLENIDKVPVEEIREQEEKASKGKKLGLFGL